MMFRHTFKEGDWAMYMAIVITLGFGLKRMCTLQNEILKNTI